MRILLINQRYYPDGEAGPAFSVQALAEGLTSMQHDVHVLCISKQDQESTENINGVTISRFVAEQNLELFSKRLIDYLEGLRPHIVHTNWLAGFPIDTLSQTCSNLAIALVHSTREYFFVCQNGSMHSNGSGPCSAPCNECHNHREKFKSFTDSVDAVIGVSEHCLAMHSQAGLFANAKLKTVIPNSLRQDAPKSYRPGTSRSDRFRVGFLGRAQSEKGLLWLIDRLNRFDNKDQYSLTVASNVAKSAQTTIQKQCPGLEINWLGFTDPENLFQQIDWLVVPSLFHEPFGRVVVESFSYSTPVIASRLGGLVELVEDKKNGFLFDPYQFGDFYQTTQKVLSLREYWDEFRLNAFSDAQEYAPRTVCEAVLSVYESVLSENPYLSKKH